MLGESTFVFPFQKQTESSIRSCKEAANNMFL